MFQRRHYEAIARMLNHCLVEENIWIDVKLIDEICQMFALDNKNFNRKKFLHAIAWE